MAIEDIEGRVGELEGEVEKLEADSEKAEERKEAVDETIRRLAGDVAVTEALGDSQRSAERAKEEVRERHDELVGKVTTLESQLMQQMQALESNRSALEILASMGEDVTEALSVLDDKQQWLETCQEQLIELGNRLDVALEAYDIGDSSGSTSSGGGSGGSLEQGEAGAESGVATGMTESGNVPVSDFDLGSVPPAVPLGDPPEDGLQAAEAEGLSGGAGGRDLSFAVRDEKDFGEISSLANQYYLKSEEFSKNTGAFAEYAEHKWAHIKKVYEKAVEAAREFNAGAAEDGDYAPLSDADIRVLKSAALYHDTGMDGDEENLRAILKSKGKTPTEVADMLVGDGMEKQVRKNHSMSSALNVLKDRKAFISIGVDPDMAALVCAIHSKSNSGVSNLRDAGQWNKLVGELSVAAKIRGVTFDTSKIVDQNGNVTETVRRRCSSLGFCIRVGDANGHDMTDNELQNGSHRVLNKDAFKPGSGWWLSRNKSKEVKVNQVSIVHPDGSSSTLDNPIGKTFAFGEGNIRHMSMHREGDTMVEKIVVDRASFAPCSTMHCVGERAAELATADGLRTRIRLVLDAKGLSSEELVDLKKLYSRESWKIAAATGDRFKKPIGIDLVINT